MRMYFMYISLAVLRARLSLGTYAKTPWLCFASLPY